jgi:putative NIF3 family GTP cyclohydrolase 1 type 2
VPTSVLDIVGELDGILQPARFQDYCPNGLQVPGPTDVATVATGVSAHAELFELAATEGADLLIVHHGLFWGAGPGPIDDTLKRRLQILFDADIGLAAYHLPLDAHPEIGNNALLARAIGAVELEPFALHHGEPIGFLARLPDDGAGAGFLADAASAGADALLTGEPAERVMAQARESGLHFIAAGHYATETRGIKRLGEHLAERFHLRHVFLDVPNPV